MGTNYYLHKKVCEHCGRGDDPIHIGKSSFGWVFSLHVTDEIQSLEDWKREFKTGIIKNEYGEIIDETTMIRNITERQGGGFEKLPFGYVTWREFHRSNHSEEGPNGLLRHKLSSYCVGHGEGTWDLCPGEFS